MPINQSTANVSIETLLAISKYAYDPLTVVNGANLMGTAPNPNIAAYSLIHPVVFYDTNNNVIIGFRGSADLQDANTDSLLMSK